MPPNPQTKARLSDRIAIAMNSVKSISAKDSTMTGTPKTRTSDSAPIAHSPAALRLILTGRAGNSAR